MDPRFQAVAGLTRPGPPAAGEVHVWLAELRSADCAVYHPLLDPAEQARAARFRFDRDRDRFICAHGILRTILGRYTATPPDQLAFHTAAHGKPSLDPGRGLSFNMSHSRTMAAIAVSGAAAVGIDIEAIDAASDIDAIAAREFAPSDRASLASLQGAARLTRFFELWTRREAYLKALGVGLGAADGPLPAGWFVLALPPIEGYAGAVVVQSPAPPRLQCFRYERGAAGAMLT